MLGGLYALTGARGHNRIVIARVAQALLGGAIVLLLGLLAATLMNPLAGLWAMALGALYVPLINRGRVAALRAAVRRAGAGPRCSPSCVPCAARIADGRSPRAPSAGRSP